MGSFAESSSEMVTSKWKTTIDCFARSLIIHFELKE